MKANLSQKKGFSEMKSGNNFFWRYSRWKTATQRKSFESVGRLKYFFFSAAIFFFGSNIDSSRVEARTSEMKLFLSFLFFLISSFSQFFSSSESVFSKNRKYLSIRCCRDFWAEVLFPTWYSAPIYLKWDHRDVVCGLVLWCCGDVVVWWPFGLVRWWASGQVVWWPGGLLG